MAENPRHERYSIPHAEDLFSDTWAENTVCPNCGLALEPGASHCPKCWQWIGECGRSCPGCPSPKCVGGNREPKDARR
jgi:hypothetical protein